jgi:hypothetical protein
LDFVQAQIDDPDEQKMIRASHDPINAPPSIEKLKVLQSISSAVVDQTATLLTFHFSKFINDLHMRSFLFVLAQNSISTAPSRRWCQRVGNQADPILDSVSQNDNIRALTSQCRWFIDDIFKQCVIVCMMPQPQQISKRLQVTCWHDFP